MRMEKKADNKKSKRRKMRNADDRKKDPEKSHNFTFTLNGVTLNADDKKKINKQTIKERNLSFKSLSPGWTLHLHTERDANS